MYLIQFPCNTSSQTNFLLRTPGASYKDTFNMEEPWNSQPVFLRLPHEAGRAAEFFKIDVFHTVSLGVGKNWTAGGLSLISTLCPGDTIDERLKSLSSDYLEYCKDLWHFSVCLLYEVSSYSIPTFYVHRSFIHRSLA